MARFVARADLDAVIARTVARRAVDRLKPDVESGAQRRSPEVHVWVTARDELVRPAHADADQQAIPGNLRFRLPRMIYVRKGRGPDGKAVNPAGGYRRTEGYDLARRPRDETLP